MDWSKAKSILIAVLLVCDLVIGSFYIADKLEAEKTIKQETASAVAYVENRGIKINCEISTKQKKISVISLQFETGNGRNIDKYDTLNVEVLGLSPGEYISGVEKTGVKLVVQPAYTALLKCVDSLSGSIDGLELIYLVDRSSYSAQAVKDTALPYWKLTSDNSIYYYAAYSD